MTGYDLAAIGIVCATVIVCGLLWAAVKMGPRR